MSHEMRISARISLPALRANLHTAARRLSENQKIVAVIKTDAYGHGALAVATALETEDCLWGYAVATAPEALALREGGIEKPILILGLVFPEEYEALVDHQVSLTISNYQEARSLSAAAEKLQKEALVHLALDTGMSRIGFRPGQEAVEEIIRLSSLPGLSLQGLFTHFAKADEEDLSATALQLERYTAFAQALEKAGICLPLHHCFNSAAIMRLVKPSMQLVREGIILYGIYPSEEVPRDDFPLAPVMSLVSHISLIKEVPAGTPVSYGGTFVTEKATRIATLPVGYGDGYPRGLSGKGYVLIRGKRAPILGRVCMDQCMVDVTEIPEAVVGEKVVLLGSMGEETITVEDLSRLSGVFTYELVCNINKRVPRVYVESPRVDE